MRFTPDLIPAPAFTIAPGDPGEVGMSETLLLQLVADLKWPAVVVTVTWTLRKSLGTAVILLARRICRVRLDRQSITVEALPGAGDVVLLELNEPTDTPSS